MNLLEPHVYMFISQKSREWLIVFTQSPETNKFILFDFQQTQNCEIDLYTRPITLRVCLHPARRVTNAGDCIAMQGVAS